MPKFVAVILASGRGERSGFSRPKQLQKLGGRPLVAHPLERFQSHPDIDEIAVVTNDLCIDEIEALVSRERLTKVKKILLGGEERYESSLSAIRAYETEAQSADIRLLFHDAVRPLIAHSTISDVIAALSHYGAVDTAVSAADTVIFADPVTGTISDIPDRRLVRLGQTPQGFHYEVIRDAYDKALLDPNFRTTDDCGVVLKYSPDEKIYVVEGSLTNLKLTYADDLLVIDKFLQNGAGRRLDALSDSMSLSRLADKTIVVLGGTSGIGASIAELAKAYGAKVHAAGRSTGVDIKDAASIEKLLEEAAGGSGRIDAVVNAAAVLNRQPLANMSLEEIAESINTNILGAVNVAKLSYPYLSAAQGHLTFFASSSYTYGRALYSTYSASKAAVVNLTQALADEWADAGVKVNCVNPERSRTPMRVKAFGIEPPESLLDPEDVARKTLSILIGPSTGIIYDIVKTRSAAPL
ncbi:bifunctional cytidylyltransferase/SDR family oxidoreductase [Phenylobacterium sp.]|uniref:bifunctional cytidylyltransferase/SDR family oxidoreductase n=1 Tax=Phenylobacterium sp. TaxID=1871053 RepID=UPI002FC99D6F